VTAPDPRPVRDIARLLASLDGRSEPDDTDRAAAEEFVAALEADGWAMVKRDELEREVTHGAWIARRGCCISWPKPCTYHEGWLDGTHHTLAAVSRREDPQ
jgi:hypothetical protein